MHKSWLALLLSGLLSVVPVAASPRNVILMIADGAGDNAWRAAALYLGNEGHEFHRDGPWVFTHATTHELRGGPELIFSREHGTTQHPGALWAPDRAWDATPAPGEKDGIPFYFEGYRWLRQGPDSANTGTTLSTGVKTYSGGINVDGNKNPIVDTLASLAHRSGRRVGLVTSVPFNHATGAALGGAHSDSRRDRCEIAVELLTSDNLDVIAGAGHPEFDNNGTPLSDPDRMSFRNIGSRAVWRALHGDDARLSEPFCGEIELSSRARRNLRAWSRVETRDDIESLATGSTPTKLLMLPRVGQRYLFDGAPEHHSRPYDELIGGTLQQARGSLTRADLAAPGDDPRIETVPSLASLTRAALNALDDDSDGLFLVVEGGAVDWAMHRNQMGRMIEEMISFLDSVEAVTRWIEHGPGWEDVLLVVTADHDHLIGGPKAHEVPFHALEDRGPGELPAYRWLSKTHSRLPVPVWVRGPGAASLLSRVRGRDPYLGEYVDQQDLHRLLREAIVGVPP